MDVYRANLKTGAVELDTTNPGDIGEWLADDNMVIRAARVFTAEVGYEIRVRGSALAKWRTIVKTGVGALKQYLVGMVDFSKDGARLFWSHRWAETLPHWCVTIFRPRPCSRAETTATLATR